MKPSTLITIAAWLSAILFGALGSLIHPATGLGVAAGLGLAGGLFVRRIEEREEEEARHERIFRTVQERAEADGQAQHIDYPHERAEIAGDRIHHEVPGRVER